MLHLVYARDENLGVLCCLLIIDFLAMFSFSLFLEGHTHCPEKFSRLFVRLGGRHEADIEPADLFYLIVGDLGEDELLFDAAGIVALPSKEFGFTPRKSLTLGSAMETNLS